MICFTQEFAEKYAGADYSLLQHRFWFPAGNPPIIPISKEQAVRLLLQLILMKMNRFYLPGSVTNSSRREAELVRRFLVNLEQNPKVASSVSSHATLLGVSTETLSETVKKENGKTPGTLISAPPSAEPCGGRSAVLLLAASKARRPPSRGELSRIGQEREYAHCHTDRSIQWHRMLARNSYSYISIKVTNSEQEKVTISSQNNTFSCYASRRLTRGWPRADRFSRAPIGTRFALY